MSFSFKVHLPGILTKLKSMSGVTFEEHANYILSTIYPFNYQPTRTSGDEGIDGFRRINKNEIYIYSIHTKVPNPNKVDKRTKMRNDLNDALSFVTKLNEGRKNKYKFEKWIVVTNYTLGTSDKFYLLTDLSEEYKIKIDLLEPEILVQQLVSEQQLLNVAAYFHSIDMDLPFSFQSNDFFTSNVLQMICDYKYYGKSTTEKKDLLTEITATIYKKAGIFENRLSGFGKYYKIKKRTYMEPLHFRYEHGRFRPLDLDKLLIIITPYFYEVDNYYGFYADNLIPLRNLCSSLYSQLISTGDYDVEEALRDCLKKQTLIVKVSK